MTIKKYFFKIVIILLMLISVTSCYKKDDGNKESNIEFTLSEDETYYILSSIGDYTDSDYIIPDEYNGLPVTEIGECAFFKCNYLENVTIGSNITTIRKRAFYECISMEKIVIPKNVLVIESNAFPLCHSLVIYCESEKPIEGWEENWNSEQSTKFGYLISIPEQDEETIRVKTLFEQKYALLSEKFKDNYSKEYYSDNFETTYIEKKINGDYYYEKSSAISDDSVHVARYYEKINDTYTAAYDVYDNLYENNGIEKAYQFKALLKDLNYVELNYDVTSVFSPAAVYREVDGKITIEDYIDRLKFDYYNNPFMDIAIFNNHTEVKFTFEFNDYGVEGYVETPNKGVIFTFKFNTIIPDEEFSLDKVKEHGTEGDVINLRQYLTLNEYYAIPKLTASYYDFNDKYFKVKLTPGYYVCKAKDFSILNKDLEPINLNYTTLIDRDTNYNSHFGFTIDQEIDGYLLIKCENIKDSVLKFSLNKLERAPEIREVVEFNIGDTVNVTDMQSYDVAKFTTTCEPYAAYLVETSNDGIYINGEYYTNNRVFTNKNREKVEVRVSGVNTSFKIKLQVTDEPENSIDNPIPLSTEFDNTYSLTKKDEYDYFSFNVNETGYLAIEIDCEEDIYLYLYYNGALYNLDQQSYEIWSCRLLEPGEYIVEIENDSNAVFVEYKIKYSFSPDLNIDVDVDYNEAKILTYEFNHTKYAKTEHHYNIRVSESTELIIKSSLAGYRVKKTGSDIVYRSLYDNNEDYVYLNEGEYQIFYYSSSSEKEYSLKLTFKQKNFEQDTFTCNVIEIGKEYSFDFQTQDYYLFKLNINDDLCFNYTGNVITYRCYDAAYVFVTKLEINDNMWNCYDIGRDYFYIIVMKDQTNEGKFLVLSRESSH